MSDVRNARVRIRESDGSPGATEAAARTRTHARLRYWATPWPTFLACELVAAICLAVVLASAPAAAQPSVPGRISITFEGLNVRQQRNDVRIPPETGTPVLLVDLVGASATRSVRVMVTADVTERQQVRFVYAPLRLSGRGRPAISALIFEAAIYVVDLGRRAYSLLPTDEVAPRASARSWASWAPRHSRSA